MTNVNVGDYPFFPSDQDTILTVKVIDINLSEQVVLGTFMKTSCRPHSKWPLCLESLNTKHDFGRVCDACERERHQDFENTRNYM